MNLSIFHSIQLFLLYLIWAIVLGFVLIWRRILLSQLYSDLFPIVFAHTSLLMMCLIASLFLQAYIFFLSKWLTFLPLLLTVVVNINTFLKRIFLFLNWGRYLFMHLVVIIIALILLHCQNLYEFTLHFFTGNLDEIFLSFHAFFIYKYSISSLFEYFFSYSLLVVFWDLHSFFPYVLNSSYFYYPSKGSQRSKYNPCSPIHSIPLCLV